MCWRARPNDVGFAEFNLDPTSSRDTSEPPGEAAVVLARNWSNGTNPRDDWAFSPPMDMDTAKAMPEANQYPAVLAVYGRLCRALMLETVGSGASRESEY